MLRNRLTSEGLPAIHCPSHIIPIHVGDPVLSTKAMHDLRNRWNIYIQAINYPTVKFGEERLRLAPSPFHDQDMIDYFMKAIKVWRRVTKCSRARARACVNGRARTRVVYWVCGV